MNFLPGWHGVAMNVQAPGGDNLFSLVEVLLHMDGASGGTTFTDVKGHTFTSSGSSPTTNTTTKKFGTASLAGNSGGGLQASGIITPGTGNRTIEFWVYWVNSAGQIFFCSFGGAPAIGANANILTYVDDAF